MKLMVNAAPPGKLPDNSVMVNSDPTTDTAPVRIGLPGGENNTLVPALQLKDPGRVMTMLPLIGIGLAGVIATVMEIALPPLAGLESVMDGDIGPKESVRTSHTSTLLDTEELPPTKPHPRYKRPCRGRTAGTRKERAVVSVWADQEPVDTVKMSTSSEYWPVNMPVADFKPPANTAMP